MTIRKETINGVKYTITQGPDGDEYDPPIPPADLEQWQARLNGRLHDMLSSRRAPNIDTDSTRFQRLQSLEDHFGRDTHHLQEAVNTCKRLGLNPDAVSYQPQLAKRRNDPAAFIPQVGPKEHLQRLANSQGQDCEGPISVKSQTEKPPVEYKPHLADDIVTDIGFSMMRQDPDLAGRARANPTKVLPELRERIIDAHAPKK